MKKIKIITSSSELEQFVNRTDIEVIQMDINSLAHTKWNCKYHIVFAPKYRRKVAYGKIKQDIADILSMLTDKYCHYLTMA